MNVLPDRRAVDADRPAVSANDQVDDAEAETDTARLAGETLVHAIEAAEDPSLLADRNADAVILHGEQHRPVPIMARATTMRFSAGEYLSAFSSRFRSAVDSASASASTGGSPGALDPNIAVDRHPLANRRDRGGDDGRRLWGCEDEAVSMALEHREGQEVLDQRG